MDIQLDQLTLQLLSEKAIYLPESRALLVADLHAGKSETFQQFGIPVSTQVNQATIERLSQLCDRLRPERLFILGDWFHSSHSLVDAVLEPWARFLVQRSLATTLVVGNHDRQLLADVAALSVSITIVPEMEFAGLWLTHAPEPPTTGGLTLCGHVHPCVTLRSALDSLRLPCFYWDRQSRVMILPSFGDFTGGYTLPLTAGVTAFAIAETELVALGEVPDSALTQS